MAKGELAELANRLRSFARERDWERFHSPRNLAASVSIEAAELQEVFQWLTDDESMALTGDQLNSARRELADVAIYLIRLADRLDVDLMAAIKDKIEDNARRYPVGLVRGISDKRP